MDIKRDIMWRVNLVFIGIALLGMAVLGQVFRLSLVQGNYWRSKADSLNTDFKNIEAVRGNIYAADGNLLATSIPLFEVRFDATASGITKALFNRSVDSLAFLLSRTFFDRNESEYRKLLYGARRTNNRYLLLQRNVTYAQLKAMRRWPLFKLGQYKGGLIALQKNTRQKPYKILASRTIGYNMEGGKAVGIEGSFSEYLKGTSGKRLMQRISGNVWRPVNDENLIDPKDGYDIITTIDVNIQDVAESALQQQLALHNADHGCAVLMEVQTGEIKAIANLRRNGDTYAEDYNYAIGEATEPGSTFKTVAIAAALEEKLISVEDSIWIGNGEYKVYDRTMKDAHEPESQTMSLRRAFEVSSNVGIAKAIVRKAGKNPRAFVHRIDQMGLNRKLELQIAGEVRPRIKQPGDTDWSGTTLPWMTIGYEVRLTPLQLLTFYNAIANKGILVNPLLVQKITSRGKVIQEFKATQNEQAICSPSTVETITELLTGVIENGTGKNLRNPNFKIAGKTGTAQISKGKGGYTNDSTAVTYQASFVGFFPADKPRYSCIVVVNSPRNNVYYAAQVAGPIFKEIANKIYSTRLDLHPALNDEAPLAKELYKPLLLGTAEEQQNLATVLAQPFKVRSIPNEVTVSKTLSVPNVQGYTLRDALYLLENEGLKVIFYGRGKVISQSIPAGSPVRKGNAILIYLA